MNQFKNCRLFIYRIISTAFIFLNCKDVYADMPPAPSNDNFSKGDVIAGIADLCKQAVGYAIPLIMAVGVMAYMWALVAAFMHSKHHKEWGSFLLVAVIGAVLVVILFILGNIAMSHFGNG